MSEQGEKKQVPEIEGLFVWPSDEMHLIGGTCKTCGSRFFPKFYSQHRPGCPNRDVVDLVLSNKGVLKSFTIHNYPPPPPCVDMSPYAIGLVEFPEGIQVPGMIVGRDFDKLRVGLKVDVVPGTLLVDEAGTEHMTWMYRISE